MPKGRQKVAKCGVEREDGWLYFIDKKGSVCKVKMKRSKSRRKATQRKTTTRRRTTARRKTTRKKTARRGTARKKTPEDAPPYTRASKDGAEEAGPARPALGRRRGLEPAGATPPALPRSGSDSVFRAGSDLVLAACASTERGFFTPQGNAG